MPQRLRVKNIQDNTDLLADLDICADDPRLYRWIDAFEEQALVWGRWWGTTQLVQFCITGGCLVLPRQIALIESANLGSSHAQMRNSWYEFIKPHAPCESRCSSDGCNCGCGAVNIQDNGTVPSFRTTTGTNQKMRFYPGNAADVGKKIIVQGNDSNGIWVRSTIDGSRQDGEQVTLALPFVDTVTVWGPGAPFAVMKEVTSYRVLVYSVDQTTGEEIQLADYEPTETEPAYRRVYIPGYCSPSSQDSSEPTCQSSCGSRSLKAIVSLDKIPVRTPNDWLLFTNLSAYRFGLQAQRWYKEGNQGMGDGYFFGNPRAAKNARGVSRYSDGMGALPILRAELRKYTGDVTSVNIQTTNTNLAGFR